LIACDNPPPSAAATQEALSAIQENLRELDTLCAAASAPFVCAQSLEELEARRDSLAAQAASNNVRTYCVPLIVPQDDSDLPSQVKLKALIDSLRLMCENIALVAT
jgi:hypothetical protein